MKKLLLSLLLVFTISLTTNATELLPTKQTTLSIEDVVKSTIEQTNTNCVIEYNLKQVVCSKKVLKLVDDDSGSTVTQTVGCIMLLGQLNSYTYTPGHWTMHTYVPESYTYTPNNKCKC